MNRVLLALVILLLTGLPAAAQSRVALVVGVSRYQSPDLQPLPNAVADARAVAAKLSALGFATELRLDPTGDDLQRALADLFLRRRTTGADTVLIYFAGHGVQANGDGFLLATDSEVVPRNDLELQQPVGVADLLHTFSEASVAILLLDACRNTPGLAARLALKTGNSLTAGFPRLPEDPRQPGRPALQLVISYSAEPGARALDAVDNHRNSPYAEALLDYLGRPGLELASVLQGVRRYVKSLTEGHQSPMFEDRRQPGAAFYFQANLAPQPGPASPFPAPPGATGRIPASEALALLTHQTGVARADALRRLLADPGLHTPLRPGDALALLGDIPDDAGRRRRALSSLLPFLAPPLDPAAADRLLAGLSEISRRTALLEMRGCFARPMPDQEARILVEGIPRSDIPWIYRELTTPAPASARCADPS